MSSLFLQLAITCLNLTIETLENLWQKIPRTFPRFSALELSILGLDVPGLNLLVLDVQILIVLVVDVPERGVLVLYVPGFAFLTLSK